MRPFVAIIAVPLRHLTSDREQTARETTTEEIEDAAAKLRDVRQHSEDDGPAAESRPVPDHGVVCSDEGNGYLFATAADTEVSQFSNTAVTDVASGEWIETDSVVDVEGWA